MANLRLQIQERKSRQTLEHREEIRHWPYVTSRQQLVFDRDGKKGKGNTGGWERCPNGMKTLIRCLDFLPTSEWSPRRIITRVTAWACLFRGGEGG